MRTDRLAVGFSLRCRFTTWKILKFSEADHEKNQSTIVSGDCNLCIVSGYRRSPGGTMERTSVQHADPFGFRQNHPAGNDDHDAELAAVQGLYAGWDAGYMGRQIFLAPAGRCANEGGSHNSDAAPQTISGGYGKVCQSGFPRKILVWWL